MMILNNTDFLKWNKYIFLQMISTYCVPPPYNITASLAVI